MNGASTRIKGDPWITGLPLGEGFTDDPSQAIGAWRRGNLLDGDSMRRKTASSIAECLAHVDA